MSIHNNSVTIQNLTWVRITLSGSIKINLFLRKMSAEPIIKITQKNFSASIMYARSSKLLIYIFMLMLSCVTSVGNVRVMHIWRQYSFWCHLSCLVSYLTHRLSQDSMKGCSRCQQWGWKTQFRELQTSWGNARTKNYTCTADDE